MGSSKQNALGFNAWTLNDKPHMDDFNADNALADGLISGLRQDLGKKPDYEQGVWMPNLYGFTNEGNPTYDAQRGEYVKIGKLVWVKFFISVTDLGDMAGVFAINNLPFPIKDSNFWYDSWLVRSALSFPQSDFCGGIFLHNSSYLRLDYQRTNGTRNSLQESMVNTLPLQISGATLYTTAD